MFHKNNPSGKRQPNLTYSFTLLVTKYWKRKNWENENLSCSGCWWNCGWISQSTIFQSCQYMESEFVGLLYNLRYTLFLPWALGGTRKPIYFCMQHLLVYVFFIIIIIMIKWKNMLCLVIKTTCAYNVCFLLEKWKFISIPPTLQFL